MTTTSSLNLNDLIQSLSRVTDLMNPAVDQHHRQVAYIAYQIATRLKLDPAEINDIVLAATLHDIGAFSDQERLKLLEFEPDQKINRHAEAGYYMLSAFGPLQSAAHIIRYHHTGWDMPGNKPASGIIPIGSYILELADRIAIQITPGRDVLNRVEDIKTSIVRQSGRMFAPITVQAFLDIADYENFWLDSIYEPMEHVLRSSQPPTIIDLNSERFTQLANMLRTLIDFRSEFTSTHSAGVACTASQLASISGFDDEQSKIMLFAGYLHDLGKLAIPREILEKTGSLSPYERHIMRAHTYYTDRMLRPIPALNTIREWGALHHEHIDGTGYPFHLREENLSTGSRIMAIADVFTAITEDRPYRSGMAASEAQSVLRRMASKNALDSRLVQAAIQHFENLNELRHEVQQVSSIEYKKFVTALS